jgi:hypothetical protein
MSMEEPKRFAVVFAMLEELTAEERTSEQPGQTSEEIVSESREIAELQRLISEINSPTPSLYTST